MLGNLPRSRPGTRSDKRASAGGAKPAGRRGKSSAAKETGGAKGAGAAKASGAAKRGATSAKRANPAQTRRPAGPKRSVAPPAPADPRGERRGEDPVGEALRGAAKAATAGLRVANGVTREVLRRLPRP